MPDHFCLVCGILNHGRIDEQCKSAILNTRHEAEVSDVNALSESETGPVKTEPKTSIEGPVELAGKERALERFDYWKEESTWSS